MIWKNSLFPYMTIPTHSLPASWNALTQQIRQMQQWQSPSRNLKHSLQNSPRFQTSQHWQKLASLQLQKHQLLQQHLFSQTWQQRHNPQLQSMNQCCQKHRSLRHPRNQQLKQPQNQTQCKQSLSQLLQCQRWFPTIQSPQQAQNLSR